MAAVSGLEPQLYTTSSPTPSQTSTTRALWVMFAGFVTIVLLIIPVVVVFNLIFEAEEESELAREVKKMMNMSADPCVDFYNFACGGWHELENVQNATSQIWYIPALKVLLKKQLKALLNKQIADNDPPYRTLVKKFFAACSNLERRNKRGREPFMNLVKSIGAFPVLIPSLQVGNYSREINSVMIKLALLDVSPLFDIRIRNETGNGMISIECPRTDSLKEALYRNASEFMNWTVAVLELLGVNTVNADKNLTDIFKVEQIVQEARANCLSSSSSKSNVMSISQLNERASKFYWTSYFKEISKAVLKEDQQLTEDDSVYIENLDYIVQLQELFGKPNDTIVSKRRSNQALLNYLMMSLLRFTVSLDSAFWNKWKNFNMLGSFGDLEVDQCLLQTQTFFPELLGRMYSDEYFPEFAVSFVHDLISHLKLEFHESIQDSWLSFRSRSDSTHMLAYLQENISYPFSVNTEDFLDNLYKTVPTHEYFEAIIAHARLRFARKIGQIRKHNATVWDGHYFKLDHLLINKNSLVLPALLLNNPVYNKFWTSAMRYGSLGSLIGHQISHMFFNKEGVFLSNESTEVAVFNEKTKCFIGQYNQFVFQGLQVDGTKTLIENVCDHEGVRQSFKAYRMYVSQSGTDAPIPGLGFTEDQLFFLSYAQMQCQKIPTAMSFATLQSRIPPFQVRVNGTLQNSRAFSEAFGCQQGQQMRPDTRCRFL